MRTDKNRQPGETQDGQDCMFNLPFRVKGAVITTKNIDSYENHVMTSTPSPPLTSPSGSGGGNQAPVCPNSDRTETLVLSDGTEITFATAIPHRGR